MTSEFTSPQNRNSGDSEGNSEALIKPLSGFDFMLLADLYPKIDQIFDEELKNLFTRRGEVPSTFLRNPNETS